MRGRRSRCRFLRERTVDSLIRCVTYNTGDDGFGCGEACKITAKNCLIANCGSNYSHGFYWTHSNQGIDSPLVSYRNVFVQVPDSEYGGYAMCYWHGAWHVRAQKNFTAGYGGCEAWGGDYGNRDMVNRDNVFWSCLLQPVLVTGVCYAPCVFIHNLIGKHTTYWNWHEGDQPNAQTIISC